MKVAYKKLKDLDLYKADNFKSLISRVEALKPDSKRLWGKMEVDQMLHHLNLSIGSGLGLFELEDKSNFMSRSAVKFLVLNVLKSLPVESKTPPSLVVKERYDFEVEKHLLIEILKKAFDSKSDQEWPNPHTLFGKLNRKEWGKLAMIHVNHHLLQFGE